MFIKLDKIYFPDDDTPYKKNKNIDQVIRTIEETQILFSYWFKDNKIKLNPDKCCLLLSDNEVQLLNIRNYVIKISQNEKLLGVSIDRKLNVQCHIENLGTKVNGILQTLTCEAKTQPFTDVF